MELHTSYNRQWYDCIITEKIASRHVQTLDRPVAYKLFLPFSDVVSVKKLCKMRDGVIIFNVLTKRDIQILIDVICIS